MTFPLRFTTIPAGLALGLGLFATAPAAFATDVTVHPGESIQAALDAADPGAAITVEAGSYAESLTIVKPVTLIGAQGAALTPPSTVPVNACTQDPDSGGGSPGLCIVGELEDPTEEGSTVVTPVSDVSVSGFTVSGFTLPGVEVYGAENVTLTGITSTGNTGGGAFIAQADGVHLSRFVARANASHGLDLHEDVTDFTITGSTFRKNAGHGLFLGDGHAGVIRDNVFAGNCTGLTAVDLGFPDGNGIYDLVIGHNVIRHNNRFCPQDGDGAPSFSGNGLLLGGVRHSAITHNKICFNEPSEVADLTFGGVALFDMGDLTGGAAPRHNRVAHNVVAHNAPANLTYDGSGSDNTLAHNRRTGSC